MSHVVATTVAVGAMVATSRAHADLLRPGVPTLTWGGGFSFWMPAYEDRSALAARLRIVWTPSFAAFSTGVSGQAPFRSSPRLSLAPFVAQGGAGDPSASVKAGSVRLITALGPMGVAALGLFETPLATQAHPVVMRVAPVFGAGGGGLEMRCTWW